jgi:hypothetical protein
MGEPTTADARNGFGTVLHTSVATLFSNLVTRPTGRAVRYAIEQRIEESGGPCLSILDFSRVGIVDFSCADEIVAKLLERYRLADRPADAFFVVKGVAEHHREPIETVLKRRNLLVVAIDQNRPALWGPAPARLRLAWNWLSNLGRAYPDDLAAAHGLTATAAGSWLNRLVNRRVAISDAGEGYSSLPALFATRPQAGAVPGGVSQPTGAAPVGEGGAESEASAASWPWPDQGDGPVRASRA